MNIYEKLQEIDRLVNQLIAERDKLKASNAELLEALERAYRYPQVGGGHPEWMDQAYYAITHAKEAS
ncbi:MAG: hypothetical protein ABIU85_02235 [Methylotenera sp.]